MNLAVTLKRTVSVECWEQNLSEWVQEGMDEGEFEAVRDSSFELYKREHRERAVAGGKPGSREVSPFSKLRDITTFL